MLHCDETAGTRAYYILLTPLDRNTATATNSAGDAGWLYVQLCNNTAGTRAYLDGVLRAEEPPPMPSRRERPKRYWLNKFERMKR